VLLPPLLAACASDPPTSTIAPGREGAPGIERFLLCPANLVVALRAELEAGVEPLQEQIVAHLRANGREVERLALPEARALWEQSSEGLPGSGGELRFETAAAAFARRLGDSRDFQALVLPSLIVQQVLVRHRGASWDGVERRVRLVNAPRPTAGRKSDLLVDRLSTGSLHASVRVASLHVMVLAADGARIFEGRGGLDFLEEVDLAEAVETLHVELKLRGDLFEDREILREGVEIAFTPLLPPARAR
jgi:hypothetical protein